jgi:hypothetical protein
VTAAQLGLNDTVDKIDSTRHSCRPRPLADVTQGTRYPGLSRVRRRSITGQRAKGRGPREEGRNRPARC